MGSAAGGIGSIIGGIAGNAAGAGDRGDARNAAIIANQILQEIGKAPEISKPLILEKYRQAGILTPQMEQYISSGQSQASKVDTDQQSLDAQRKALTQMSQRAAGGLSAGDRAALAEAQLKTQGDTSSKVQQILQGEQARHGGVGASGRGLAAQLQAAQSGSNQQASNSNAIAQMAAQNALQATAMTGQLGGQINQQKFNQDTSKAQAADEMNRFNVANQIGAQQRNVGTSNQAQAANLANVQGIDNANVGQQNAEAQNQLQRQMQQYQANVNRAQIQAGGMGNMANNLNVLGNQAAQGAYNQWAGIGQAVGGLAGAFGSMGGSKPTGYAGADPKKDPTNVFAYDGGQIPEFKQGGQVPGHANVQGDSPRNDTVHAMLSPGEIVVPRSLADSKIGKEILKLINAHNSVKHRLNGNE